MDDGMPGQTKEFKVFNSQCLPAIEPRHRLSSTALLKKYTWHSSHNIWRLQQQVCCLVFQADRSQRDTRQLRTFSTPDRRTIYLTKFVCPIMTKLTKWEVLPDLLNSDHSYFEMVYDYDEQPAPRPAGYSVWGVKLKSSSKWREYLVGS